MNEDRIKKLEEMLSLDTMSALLMSQGEKRIYHQLTIIISLLTELVE